MSSSKFENAPRQKYRQLRTVVPKTFRPIIRGIWKKLTLPADLEEPYRTVFPYTQAHLVRQKNLVRLSCEIERAKIAGAIVECGVLDGGTAALMAYATSNTGRPVHMFDSWEGLPDCSDRDGIEALNWIGEDVGSPRRVATIMRKLKIEPRRLHFHKGWFDKTFPEANIDRVALLHIDADFYASVKLCLDRWYPLVTPGGFIQFDDYSVYLGCRAAVDEFLDGDRGVTMQVRSENAEVYYIQKPIE
jgi:O-methyltransferase